MTINDHVDLIKQKVADMGYRAVFNVISPSKRQEWNSDIVAAYKEDVVLELVLNPASVQDNYKVTYKWSLNIYERISADKLSTTLMDDIMSRLLPALANRNACAVKVQSFHLGEQADERCVMHSIDFNTETTLSYT